MNVVDKIRVERATQETERRFAESLRYPFVVAPAFVTAEVEEIWDVSERKVLRTSPTPPCENLEEGVIGHFV